MGEGTAVQTGANAPQERGTPSHFGHGVLVLFALMGCAHARGESAAAPGGWRLVQTEHVRLRTPLRTRPAARVARALERQVQVLSEHTFPCARGKLRSQVEVTLLPGELFATVVPQVGRGAGAYFDGRSGGLTRAQSQVVMQGVTGGEALRAFSHELAHLLSHLCHAELPAWMAEGLATYVETATLRGDTLLLGVPSFLAADRAEAAVAVLEGVSVVVVPSDRLPKVETLTELEPGSFYAAAPDQAAADEIRLANYAAAAILVRALEMDEGDYQTRYQRYLGWLAKGRPPDQALRLAFHDVDLQALFDRASEARRWSVLSIPVDPPASAHPQIIPMSPADTEAHLALLWGWNSPERRERARHHVQQGLALDRTHVDLVLMDLQLKLAADDLDAASEASNAWLTKEPENLEAVRAAARIEVALAFDGRTIPGARLRALHTTLQGAGTARDLDLCAQLSLVLRDGGRARAEVNRALAADPGCASCQLTLAHVETQQRRWAEAEAALQRTLLLAGEGDQEVWQRARGLLAYVRKKNRATRDGDDSPPTP